MKAVGVSIPAAMPGTQVFQKWSVNLKMSGWEHPEEMKVLVYPNI